MFIGTTKLGLTFPCRSRGHCNFKKVAKRGSKLGSGLVVWLKLYNLLPNDVQCERPTVCDPAEYTMVQNKVCQLFLQQGKFCHLASQLVQTILVLLSMQFNKGKDISTGYDT